MKSFAAAALAVWLAASQCSVLAIPVEIQERSIEELDSQEYMSGGSKMKPVRLAHERRSTDFDGLDSRYQDSFLYGTDDGTNALANMTLVMADGRQLVSMERFEGLTTHVDCDESMSLEFVSREAFEYAIHAWGWVNDNVDDSFVMIANHEGCGPDAERVPYSITDVDYDEERFIAYLTGTPMQWVDIEATLILDYGTIPEGALARRWDVSKDVSVSVGLTKTLGASRKIWSGKAGGLDLSLNCLNCGVSGAFQISGRVKASLGWSTSLKELFVQTKPKDVQARLELEARAAGSGKYATSSRLLTAPLPGAIYIPGIFRFGATMDYDVGLDASLQGSSTVTYGVIAKIPNSAILKVDLRKPSQSQFSGWSPSFEKIPLTAKATINGRLAVYSKPGVSYGIKVLNKWGYEVALRMKLPEVAADLTAKVDTSGGLCGKPANKASLDVKLSVGVDLSFNAGSYSNSLWKTSALLHNQCFGFAG